MTEGMDLEDMKSKQNIFKVKIRNFQKQACRYLLTGVLCVTMTASGLFLGSAEAKNTDVLSADQQEAKVVALLGDLNENAPSSVKNKLRQLVNEAETQIAEREAKGNYLITSEEFRLWQDITALLDKETMRQVGQCYFEVRYSDESSEQAVDYGKEMMDNLKQEISLEDWSTLNKIRNDYFEARENGTQNYHVDTELEIRTIINKYKELDADAVLLNLLCSKDQQNLGMFVITPECDAVYQKGTENGLNMLGDEEQKALKEVWELTTDILPKELFKNFKYFKVGGDGEYGVYAYVTNLDSEGKLWCMTVDPSDIHEDGIFPYTVVHEMAHYITLNETQVDYDNNEFYSIDRYDDWYCVANVDSYIQAFYTSFWRDTMIDWYTNQENPYFYFRHQSQFVSAYASTNCAEDMAESFSAYVLMDNALTPEAQEKLDFFDSYPELKSIKTDILNNVKKNEVYVNSEIEPTYEQDGRTPELDGFVDVMVAITAIFGQ